ncbi:bifunctional biotin--[acetyl-CoA-carboxylase] ligase/biotin operon repressor BirA [Methylomagnum sp.]
MPVDALTKTLLRLLSDHRFHSGTELAAALGVSRTAVWKHVRDLEALGLDIAAVSGKGYRLVSPLQLLDEAAIRADLNPPAAALLAKLELHDQLDSTNTYLMQAAPAGAVAGTVCLAETQTAGRGRIGREWLSPFGSNIYLSLLWRFEGPSRVAGLSLAVGVAVVRALAGLGFGEAGLKWPNDVLWGESKLGGILLEVAGEAHGSCVVVIGVGLNRHMPPRLGRAIDQPWADLASISGASAPPRNRLVAALLNELLPLVADYEGYGLAPWLPEWRRLHRFQGRDAVVHVGEARIKGRIADVSDEGLLVLECEDGSLRRFASGDVRLRVAGDG